MDHESTRPADSRLVCCTKCDSLHPATKAETGEIVPVTTGPVHQCPRCGNDEFEQVYLETS